MKSERIDISKFKKDSKFYGEIHLTLTIKDFDLRSIQERYIKSQNNVSGRSGSVNRRSVSIGGLATLKIQNSKITDKIILAKFPEPRGLDKKQDIFAFSSNNVVYVLTKNQIKIIRNKWFSYIHTVEISGDRKNILISSSGYDSFFEFDIKTEEKKMEWFAWENGFSESYNPTTGEKFVLTRDEMLAKKMQSKNKKCLLISDPKNYVLPTAMRAAFINSVSYDKNNPNKALATFFHMGTVNQIDLNSGKSKVILSNLVKPHGGQNFKNIYLATSTGSGEIVLGDQNLEQRFYVSKLSGKPDHLKDIEWLQNTQFIGKYLVAIDSNRTSFIIIDQEKKLYDLINYDKNWAVQDITEGAISPLQKNLLKSIDNK